MAFKTEIHKKFPPGANPNKIKRTMQELEGHRGNTPPYNSQYGVRGRGRGGRGRGGRGRGRGIGQGQGGYQQRNNSTMITLKNGKRIEYHVSYNFPMEIYSQFTDGQIDILKKERREYKQRTGGSGGSRGGNSKRSIVSNNSVPNSVRGDQSRAISQMTSGSSMMGGQNKQRQKRRRNRDGESE